MKVINKSKAEYSLIIKPRFLRKEKMNIIDIIKMIINLEKKPGLIPHDRSKKNKIM